MVHGHPGEQNAVDTASPTSAGRPRTVTVTGNDVPFLASHHVHPSNETITE